MSDIPGLDYPIVVRAGALSDVRAMLAGHVRRHRLFVVADANIAALHLPALAAALAGTTLVPAILPPGEATKSWAGLIQLCDTLLAHGIERGETIVAFGGGVIGDLAGLAAALVKRGCPVIQIPSTLLAMVDSSVGGKTAIDTPAGKNMIGLFHQPATVIVDPSLLTTLSPRELRAGYAETVKYGLIDDPVFFDWCETHGAALLAGDRAITTQAITRAIAAKARIVAADPLERGERALLNLGHSFAHGLEAEAGYGATLLHGEAVACGMALAFRYSTRLGLCAQQDAGRVTAHLAASGLPTTIAATRVQTDADALLARLRQDKKNAGGAIRLILVRGIGQAFIADDCDPADLHRFFVEELR